MLANCILCLILAIVLSVTEPAIEAGGRRVVAICSLEPTAAFKFRNRKANWNAIRDEFTEILSTDSIIKESILDEGDQVVELTFG